MRDKIKERFESYQGQPPSVVKRSLQSLLPITQGASRLHKEITGFVTLVIRAISDVFNLGQQQERKPRIEDVRDVCSKPIFEEVVLLLWEQLKPDQAFLLQERIYLRKPHHLREMVADTMDKVSATLLFVLSNTQRAYSKVIKELNVHFRQLGVFEGLQEVRVLKAVRTKRLRDNGILDVQVNSVATDASSALGKAMVSELKRTEDSLYDDEEVDITLQPEDDDDLREAAAAAGTQRSSHGRGDDDEDNDDSAIF